MNWMSGTSLLILTAAWFYDTGYFAAADPGGYEDKAPQTPLNF